MKVEITSWRKGCDSVVAIKEIRARAQIPLNEALALVNRVLANERVLVFVPSQADALQLVEELGRVGLTAQTIADSVAPAATHSVPSDTTAPTRP